MSKASPLSRVPVPTAHILWESSGETGVCLQVENTGWANRLAQKWLKRPRWSRVELDDLGSFVWRQMDGERTVRQLGELVEENFGEAAHPLYERLYGYLQILYSYGFIRWV